MKWLQSNYEKAVLAVIALICLTVGTMHILRALSYSEEFIIEPAKKNNQVPDPPTPTIQTAITIVKNEKKDVVWTDSLMQFANDSGGSVTQRIPLFDSTPIILLGGDLVNLGDPNAKQMRPPVSNNWLLSKGLNILSANVLNEDADKDGFTNLEEWGDSTDPKWQGLTDPLDPKSHPSYLNKLSYVKRNKASFFLRYATHNPPNFQINYRPGHIPNMQSLQAQQGTEFLGRYTITKHEVKEGMDGIIKRDMSELTVHDKSTGKDFILVRQQDLNWPDYYADFVFTLDNSKLRVKEGDSFELSLEPGRQYKLTATSDTDATIDDAGETVVRPLVAAPAAEGAGALTP